jgi:hypothetical protein
MNMLKRSEATAVTARDLARRFVASVLVIAIVGVPSYAGAVTHPALQPYAAERPNSLLTTKALLTGTVLSPWIDHAFLDDKGLDTVELLKRRPFTVGAAQQALEVVLPYPGPRAPTKTNQLPPQSRQAVLDELRAVHMTDELDPKTEVVVRFEDKKGMVAAEGSGLRLTAAELDPPPVKGTKAVRPPQGVFLRGGKIFPSAQAAVMAGGTLVACSFDNYKLCIRTPRNLELRTNFKIDRVLHETWKHVYGELLDTYYLSIDPTSASLKASFNGWPINRLNNTTKNNRVVVRPESLRAEEIGQILYEADVLFKSAALGFNVLRDQSAALPGYSSQGALIRAVVDSKAFPEDTKDQVRYCRFYWGSEPLGMSVENDRVVFAGAGVAAHSEAMVIRDGDLKPFPGGHWCNGGTRIARELTLRMEKLMKTSEATPAAPFDVLPRLADVTRKLSLLSWARGAGVLVDKRLEQRLDTDSPELIAVPDWTSGIRSDEPAHIRLDLRSQWHPMLRIYIDDVKSINSTLSVSKALNAVMTKHAHAFDVSERDLGRNLTPQEGKKWLDKREAELRTTVQNAGVGVVVETTWEPSQDWLPRAGAVTIGPMIDVKMHTLPVRATGGVLLRAAASEAPDAPLNRPGGGRVFLAKDGALHFWATHSQGDLDVEHLELRGFEVVSRQAYDGIIRFQLRTTEKAKLRGVHETRFAKQYATEWSRRLPLGSATESSVFFSKEQIDEVRVATLTKLTASAEGARLGDAMHIKMFKMGTEFLVELNVTGMQPALDDQWKRVESNSDVLGTIEHVVGLARFGYRKLASERLMEAVSWLGSELVDKILTTIGGLENDMLDGRELLARAADDAYVLEELFAIRNYVFLDLPLNKPARATQLMRQLRAVFEFLPPHARSRAREELVKLYEQLAEQDNPKDVAKVVKAEIKSQNAILETERVLRDGSTEERI